MPPAGLVQSSPGPVRSLPPLPLCIGCGAHSHTCSLSASRSGYANPVASSRLSDLSRWKSRADKTLPHGSGFPPRDQEVLHRTFFADARGFFLLLVKEQTCPVRGGR